MIYLIIDNIKWIFSGVGALFIPYLVKKIKKIDIKNIRNGLIERLKSQKGLFTEVFQAKNVLSLSLVLALLFIFVLFAMFQGYSLETYEYKLDDYIFSDNDNIPAFFYYSIVLFIIIPIFFIYNKALFIKNYYKIQSSPFKFSNCFYTLFSY